VVAKKTGKKPATKKAKGKVPKRASGRKKVASGTRLAKKAASGKAAKKRAASKKAVKKSACTPAKARGAAKRAKATSKKAAKKASARTTRKSTPKLAAAGAAPKQVPVDVPRAVHPKSSSYLSKKDLAQFRELLLTKRAQLVGDVSTLQAEALSKNRQDAAGDLSSMPIHMADLGTDNYEKEFTLGLIEGERALLRDIDDALLRIEAETYGICEATGKPIGKARLRARPWAKYCYEYMLAHEKGQRSSGL
jgi:RNA polymerase-binding protein DksA